MLIMAGFSFDDAAGWLFAAVVGWLFDAVAGWPSDDAAGWPVDDVVGWLFGVGRTAISSSPVCDRRNQTVSPQALPAMGMTAGCCATMDRAASSAMMKNWSLIETPKLWKALPVLSNCTRGSKWITGSGQGMYRKRTLAPGEGV